MTSDKGTYASVSLGQGQEVLAMRHLTAAHQQGGWVLLQNINLTIDWTENDLDKVVDKLYIGANPAFRYVCRQMSLCYACYSWMRWLCAD